MQHDPGIGKRGAVDPAEDATPNAALFIAQHGRGSSQQANDADEKRCCSDQSGAARES